MSDAAELETEALMLVQHIDALGVGNGGEAFWMYQEALSRAVRPLLERQREALEQQERAEDALGVEHGRLNHSLPWLAEVTEPEVAAAGMRAVAEVMALEAGLAAEWRALIRRLSELGREASR